MAFYRAAFARALAGRERLAAARGLLVHDGPACVSSLLDLVAAPGPPRPPIAEGADVLEELRLALLHRNEDQRADVLALVAPHLEDHDRPRVRAFLDDPQLAAPAALALWRRWRDDSGARRLCARGRAPALLHTLAGIPCEAVIEAIVRCLRSDDPRVFEPAVEVAPDLPDPRIVEALVVRSGERGGRKPGSPKRDCDNAALAIARILGRTTSIASIVPFAKRDRAIDELVAWWDAHKDELLWSNLRRRAWDDRDARERGDR